MNYKNLFINLLATIVLGIAGSIGMAQPTPEAFTSWTFDEAEEPQYWYGTSFIAGFGNFSNAVLYADGTHGSSQFATVTTTNYAQMLKNDWTGTVLGDPRDEPFDGYCLGIKHPNSAGRRIVLSTPTTLYSKISLRYAVTRSNTGFKKMIFEWSTDGSTYHLIQEKPCEPLDFEVQYLNLEDLAVLEDQPMIYLRITVDSILSTAYQGTQIISLDAEGEPDYMDLEDFLELHDAEKIKVAGKNRIAVGSHEVDFAARMAVEEERFPSTKTFVLKCLDVADASGVDEALEKKFGSFEWLTYDLPEETDEEDSTEANGKESAE